MNDTMTIRQMCDAFEVTPRTLRFYEAKELLAPIRVGQKRLFTNRDRARLKLILRGKRFGFSLEEIRQILDLYESNGGEMAQIRAAHEIGRRHLERLKIEKVELDSAIEELTSQLEWSNRKIAEANTHAAE